jgi:hypothetical protein
LGKSAVLNRAAKRQREHQVFLKLVSEHRNRKVGTWSSTHTIEDKEKNETDNGIDMQWPLIAHREREQDLNQGIDFLEISGPKLVRIRGEYRAKEQQIGV